TLDSTFGNGGSAISTLPFPNGSIFFARQSDGKYIAAGRATGRMDFLVARFNPNGTVDGTFGTGGPGKTGFGWNGDHANTGTPQPDGKIVVTGYAAAVGEPYGAAIALARYNPDGSLDAAFNSTGAQPGTLVSWFAAAPGYSTGTGVAIQINGKIVVSAG